MSFERKHKQETLDEEDQCNNNKKSKKGESPSFEYCARCSSIYTPATVKCTGCSSMVCTSERCMMQCRFCTQTLCIYCVRTQNRVCHDCNEMVCQACTKTGKCGICQAITCKRCLNHRVPACGCHHTATLVCFLCYKKQKCATPDCRQMACNTCNSPMFEGALCRDCADIKLETVKQTIDNWQSAFKDITEAMQSQQYDHHMVHVIQVYT